MRILVALLLLLWPLAALSQDATDETPQEERDRGFLVGLIEDNLSGVSRNVTITGFEGALSSRATIEALTIADAEGVWLRMEDLTLDWNRSALLRGRIEIDELTAGLIALPRLPQSEETAPSPEATPFSLPDLPVSIQIGTLRAERIELGAPLLGEEVALSLEGEVSLAGGEGTATVVAERLDGRPGRFEIDAAYSNATRVLALNADLNEAEDGIVARLLEIPGRPSVSLALEGTAPIDDYEATLAIATDGVPRIEGSFGLSTVEGATPEDVVRRFAADVQGDVSPLIGPQYEAFFGDQVVLAVEGARGSDGSLQLDRLRLESAALTLSGSAEIAGTGWPRLLDLEGRIAGTDGETVLLPLPGGETRVRGAVLDIGFDAAAGDAWTGTFVVEGLERPGLLIPDLELTGGGIITRAEGATTGNFTADMTYAARGLQLDDDGLTEALGAEIAGDIDLSKREGGPFEIAALTLNGPGIEAEAEATIEGPESGFQTQAALTLDAADLDRFAALAGLDLAGSAQVDIAATVAPLDGAFDLSVTGTTRDLALGIAQADPLLDGQGEIALRAVRDEDGTRIEELDISTPALTATGALNLTSGESAARFDLRIADAGLVQPGLSGPVALTGTADRDAGGVTRVDVTATAPGAEAQIGATVASPEDGGAIEAEVTASIDDLSPYAAIVGQDLSGAVDATVAGTLQPDLSLFDLEVAASTTDLAVGNPEADALLAGEGSLTGRIIRSGSESLRVEDLAVETQALSLVTTADIEEGAGTANLDLRIADAALLNDGLQGPLAVTGDVRRDAAGALTLDLDATGPDAEIAVAGTVAPPEQGYVFDGRVVADIADIAPYAALAGQEAGGALVAEVEGTLRPDLSLFDLAVDARTTDLTVGQPQADALLRGEGRLTGQLARSGPESVTIDGLDLSTPAVDLSAEAALDSGVGAATLNLRIADAAVLTDGLTGPLLLSGTASRDAAGEVTLDLDATGPGAVATVAGTLAQPEEGLTFDGRVALDVDNLGPYAQLAGRDLSGAVDAVLSGSVQPDLSRFDLALEATTQSLGVGVDAADRLLSGTGTIAARASRDEDGTLRIDGLVVDYPNVDLAAEVAATGEAGEASFDARLADIGLFTPEFSGPATATGTATRDAEGVWRIDTSATGPGGIRLDVTGTAAEAGDLDLDIDGVAPLGLANGFIEPRRLAGTADLNLSVDGPPAIGSLGGTIGIAGARLAAPTLGQSLEGINGTVTLGGGRATLALAGSFPDGGSLRISGPVGLTPPLAADLDVALSQVVLRDPELFETIASGTITIDGPLSGGARIGGTIDLGTTEIQVPSSSVGALGALPDVTHVAPPPDVRRTLDRAGVGASAGNGDGAGGGPAFPLDITINAPSRIFVRGRGLDAELGGTLRLTGTTADVVPLGQFDLIRGRLDILQQRFDLTEGSVSLQGEFVPYIRLVATTTAQTGTLINIVVEGPVTEPEVRFQSAPELPQDEVLAQLIFGRDLSEITPLQAVQLAAAVGTLAGRGGGGIISDFREGIGLDDLDIATDEAGNAALRAGKYLTDNIYTDVTIGSETTELNLNLDVTDNITVKGSAGSDGDTSLGIFYQRDY